MSRHDRCPHCRKSLITPYPSGTAAGPAGPPGERSTADVVFEQLQYLNARYNPPPRLEVQPAPRHGETLLMQNVRYFVYVDARGIQRIETKDEARRNPARMRATSSRPTFFYDVNV